MAKNRLKRLTSKRAPSGASAQAMAQYRPLFQLLYQVHLHTPDFHAVIQITPTISINENEIEEHFIRAPGPGGQKVNKTESAVQLRFNARTSTALSNAVFLRLKPLAGRRMTRDGIVVITANRFRAQEQNRRDAVERLIELIRKAAVPPIYRRPTKPSKAAKRRRQDSKHRQSTLKKNRGKINLSE